LTLALLRLILIAAVGPSPRQLSSRPLLQKWGVYVRFHPFRPVLPQEESPGLVEQRV
jgi:hypothetical protein